MALIMNCGGNIDLSNLTFGSKTFQGISSSEASATLNMTGANVGEVYVLFADGNQPNVNNTATSTGYAIKSAASDNRIGIIEITSASPVVTIKPYGRAYYTILEA